jgi:N-methylhydantoinase A
MRVGVDIGGTFTDVVAYDEDSGDVFLAKLLSTPDGLEAGVRQGVRRAAGNVAEVEAVIHGSTVVINSIIERRGAKTALVTTKGFRDVYEIGRINRPDSFNPRFRRHQPLVPRDMIFELRERVLADGVIRDPFDEDEALQLARFLAGEGVEAVGIIFLHSYRFPDHEARMAEIIRSVNPGIFVCCSHELSREYREYERTSTTAANAFVGPKVSNYLAELESGLRTDGFSGELLIMQSNGGLSDVERARRQCVQMMESGPAGGVVGTMALCDLLGVDSAVSFDMGGTTAKSCVVKRGEPSFSPDYFVGGYNEGLVMRIPVLEIVEVGTGGGSVAWVDEGGGLHVGPRSAGSSPGPACYGLGGEEPTITDANVVLGRLDPVNFLGGEMRLDRKVAVRALSEELAGPLDVDLERAASGMLEVATAAMADAVRGVTLQRGLDPRDFTLFAFGGGGPLHASSVAKQLSIGRVIVPLSPGHFSAVGMLMTDFRRDIVQTVFQRVGDLDRAQLESTFRAMEEEGRNTLAGSTSRTGAQVSYERAADMRYVGQEHTVTIRLPGVLPDDDDEAARSGIKRAFDEAHDLHYGHSAESQSAEIVTLRVQASARLDKPVPAKIEQGAPAPPPGASRGERRVFFPGHGMVPTPIFSRDALLAGNAISGPAVIEETASTTIVEPGDELLVNEFGHLVIEIGVRA